MKIREELFSEKKTDTVCLDTTRVKLGGLGMFRRCIKKSELIFWRSHIKRINFAKTYMKWIVDDWKKAIFSVESYFVIAESKRANTWTNITIMISTPAALKSIYASWCGCALLEQEVAL